MQLLHRNGLAMVAMFLGLAHSELAAAEPPEQQVIAGRPRAPEGARRAIDRGLAFLETDAVKWREERTCSTCHHGTMTLWVLCEAKSQGYAVAETMLRDVAKWTKTRLANIDKPRDTRPGWNMVSTPAVFLAVMSLAVPSQDAVSRDELERIGSHLLRHQEADGSWAWSLAPAQNRPPPVFESDEVVTLLACAALAPEHPAGSAAKAAARDGRARADEWLARNKPGTSTQSTALRLFREFRAGKAARELDAGIEQLLHLQNDDGGWGQESDFPSDAFATGEALYFLRLAGVAPDRPEIQRGVTFLVNNQKKDGSWPMRSRAHPGAKPFTNPVPITYFGSAWATLGLLRSVPK
jgi:squalene-hopene/tetraprenyl-beta-curcumene cyclase